MTLLLVPSRTCEWALSPAFRRKETASELAEPVICRTLFLTDAVPAGTARSSRGSSSGRAGGRGREGMVRSPGAARARAGEWRRDSRNGVLGITLGDSD